MRTEHDFLGSIDLSDDFPFGIHTARASHNFAFSKSRMRPDLFFAIVEVKKAAALANAKAGLLDGRKAELMTRACDKILSDIDSFVPPIHPLQGGAGTSSNMAANELVANIALSLDGKKYGDYAAISPLDDVNLSQSTNDVFPTALRIALLRSISQLHDSCEALLAALQKKEKDYAGILKIGRTELQDAMPLSLGQEFSAWAEAVSRFRWRLSKAGEWIREVNLSGTAVGTGINADRAYAAAVVPLLREITNEPLALSRNLVDATQNIDQLVELSGLVRTGAVSVKKICCDLRLLSSGPRSAIGELRLPQMQAGSSIMPGKVNPVICEAVEQVCLRVMGGDSVVASAASESNLELPQFLPLVADTILENNELFASALRSLADHAAGIEPDLDMIRRHLDASSAVATLLSPLIGYDAASSIVRESAATGKGIRELIVEKNILSQPELDRVLTPEIFASAGIIRFDRGVK
jgi:aspartate ammonia-lyase